MDGQFIGTITSTTTATDNQMLLILAGNVKKYTGPTVMELIK